MLLGIGLAGFVDEALVHQILQWHTFLWGVAPTLRTFADGLFHVASTLVLVAAALRLWLAPDSRAPAARCVVVAGTLAGFGAFELYDGLVQHALFHLHLVNEYACPNPQANNSLADCPGDVPFEIVWDALAVLLLCTGIARLRRARTRTIV